MKKIVILLFISIIMTSLSILDVDASYNYNPWGDVVASAEALIVDQIIDSSNLVDSNDQKVNISFGTFSDVSNFNDFIYLVDSSNSCVIVLNSEFHYINTFGNQEGEGKLNKPQGIFITKEYIYVADTDNYRIAIFDHNYNFISQIVTPNDPVFKQTPEDTKGYDFKPIKIAVDRTSRVYVIADQIFEGIIDFNPDGSFSRYIGANTITLSLWDAFWLNFTSEEQRKAQGFRLVSPFVNLNIDDKGYLYTVSKSTEGEKAIRKLNYKGIDILTRNGYVSQTGDVQIMNGIDNIPTGPSEFIDIDVNGFGNYSVLDQTRGRIFTYDFEGNLLYIGGQTGIIGGKNNNLSSLFMKPEALSYYKDKILVVDSINKNLMVLKYTEFAQFVNEATKNYYNGDYAEAGKVWNQVLSVNTNYYLAFSGIGKAQLREGNYEEAMVNLKLGFDDYNYSEAYQKYRYDQLTKILPYVIGVTIAGIVFLLIRNFIKSIDSQVEEENNE